MTDPPQGPQPWQATAPGASPTSWGARPSATPSWPGLSAPQPEPQAPPAPPQSPSPQRGTEPWPASQSSAPTPRRAYGDSPTSSPGSAGPQHESSPPQAARGAGPYDWQPPAPVAPSYRSSQPSGYESSQASPSYGTAQAPYGQGGYSTGRYGQQAPPYGPGGYAPQGSSPQGYAPQGYSPQSYAPQSYSSQGSSPQGYAPQGYSSQGYAPQGYSSQGYGPQGSPPGGAWASTTQWAPPSGYPPAYPGVGPDQAYGPYGSEPPYPQGPRRRQRHGGRTLLILLAIAVLVAAVIPIVSTIATSGYANSSYVAPEPNPNPPALPQIASGTSAHDTVTSSSLYAQRVPNPTRCTVTSIDLAAASESELQAHMSDVVACLMRVWDVTVAKAGYSMPRPPVVVYSAAMNTACGKLATMNAAYCGSDQKIYYATDLPQAIPSQLRSSRFIVEVIVAHEFGHAVQARTGILTAAHGLADSAATEAESHEWSRRTELQADCFAGLFIRSVSRSTGITQQDLDNIASLMIAFGDDSLSKTNGVDGGHGLGTTRKYWMQLGLASTSTSVCDTFTVSPDEVR